MLVKSYAAAVQGISATVITIEVNCTKGIQFFLVVLPDVAVRESHERIISALQVSGYKFPRNRIVINMAPADIRKEGSSYDLPLAIGILAAAEELDASRLGHYMMMGELSLDGSLKPVAIPICLFPIDIGNKAPFSGKCKSNGGLALRVELFAHQLRRKDQVPLFSADAEYLGDDGKHIPAGGTCQIVVNATPIGIKILGNAGVNFACFK